MQHKNSDLDKYSEEKYDYEEEEDFTEELSKYKHAKESSGHGKAGHKDQAKRPIMKGQQKQQQQCMMFTLTIIEDCMRIHLKTHQTKPAILSSPCGYLSLFSFTCYIVGGQRGRGRGTIGRGRGMPNKNKKQKGKNWGRGRGRGDQGGGDGVRISHF